MNRFKAAIVVAMATLIIAPARAQKTSQAQARLEAARQKETLEGNLAGAIKQYQAIVNNYGKTNRLVAATALVRMAECYRRLGDAEARTTYERVLREYADQPIANDARARLTAMGITGTNPGARATVDRVVKAGERITWGDGRVSLDGRFISYTDFEFAGNLMLHDLVTGTDRPLTGNKDWSVGNSYASTFSPDGTQVAYGWRSYEQSGSTNELRIVSIDGTGIPQPRRVYGSAEIDFFDPTDWSPDGRSLAVRVTRKDRTTQIALIGVEDGSFKALKTVGWRGPGTIFFSPDGKYLAYDLPANDDEAQRDVFIIGRDAEFDRRVVADRAQDVVMGWSPNSGHLLFASDRNGPVGLWALPVAGGKPLGDPMLLKPDIGSTQSQGLTASGALYILKDASTVGLHVAPIDLDTGKLSGPPVLKSFHSSRPDWSPDGKLLAFASTGNNGLGGLSILSVESGEIHELRPALGYINQARWLPDGRSLVTGARGLKGRTGIYRIDAQTGRETLITDTGGPPRVQVSPDGKKIYYNNIERNIETGEMRTVPRPTGGSAELSPDGRSLAVVTVDKAAKTSTLMLVPVAGGEARALFSVHLPDSLQDYSGMSWTPDSRAVVIVNSTGEEQESKDLWLVPVSGGAARKLDIDIRNWLTGEGIRLHPNGKEIAFFTGKDSREVFVLENVLPAQPSKR